MTLVSPLTDSVAEFLPNFHDRVHEALRIILGEDEKNITMGLAKDGSGVGAALTALTAKQAAERRKSLSK